MERKLRGYTGTKLTPAECAAREAFEESGYYVKIIGGQPTLSSETSEIGWFAENEIPPLSDGHDVRIAFGFKKRNEKFNGHFE